MNKSGMTKYTTIISDHLRSGKGVSSVIPILLSYPGKVITLDSMGDYPDIHPELTSNAEPGENLPPSK